MKDKIWVHTGHTSVIYSIWETQKGAKKMEENWRGKKGEKLMKIDEPSLRREDDRELTATTDGTTTTVVVVVLDMGIPPSTSTS